MPQPIPKLVSLSLKVITYRVLLSFRDFHKLMWMPQYTLYCINCDILFKTVYTQKNKGHIATIYYDWLLSAICLLVYRELKFSWRSSIRNLLRSWIWRKDPTFICHPTISLFWRTLSTTWTIFLFLANPRLPQTKLNYHFINILQVEIRSPQKSSAFQTQCRKQIHP